MSIGYLYRVDYRHIEQDTSRAATVSELSEGTVYLVLLSSDRSSRASPGSDFVPPSAVTSLSGGMMRPASAERSRTLERGTTDQSPSFSRTTAWTCSSERYPDRRTAARTSSGEMRSLCKRSSRILPSHTSKSGRDLTI